MADEDIFIGEPTEDGAQKISAIRILIREMRDYPGLAVELVEAMGMIVKPWEDVTGEQYGGPAIKQFRRATVTGEVVATVSKDFPAWNIKIHGERPKGAPTVFNKKDAERESKSFVDELLAEAGYILMSSDEEEE
jgi:hypothetical protein